MWVTRLKLKNWLNFKQADIALREQVYLIGPNASGKSNLLEVFRFLRDIAKLSGGGLQKAVEDRDGITKLRCLQARTDPEVAIEVALAAAVGDPITEWVYAIGFRSEGKGQQRLPVESRTGVASGRDRADRPDEADRADIARLTQTHLEQINANVYFVLSPTFSPLSPTCIWCRNCSSMAMPSAAIAWKTIPWAKLFWNVSPVARPSAATAGCGAFKRRCKSRYRNSRNCASSRMRVTGHPHLEAFYEHWRPNAGWQREKQFSDGTLRLLALLWSLLDGDSRRCWRSRNCR